MKKIKQLILKNGGILAALAFTIGLLSANRPTCIWFNQPEFPQELNQYRK